MDEQLSDEGMTVLLGIEWELLPNRLVAPGQHDLFGLGAVQIQVHHRLLLRVMHQA